jgi:hypothetical protein
MKNVDIYSPVRGLLGSAAAIALLAIGTTVPGAATPVSIVNPSFEANGSGPTFCPNITGWSCTLNGNIFNETQQPGTSVFSGGVPNGLDAACVGCFGGGADDFFQTLTTPLAANTTYTMSVFIGWDNLFNAPPEPFTVSLEANGTVLASDSSLTLVKNSFVKDTIVFNSGASPAQLGQDLLIRLKGNGNGGVGAVTV